MIIRRQRVTWKFWWTILQYFFCDSSGEPIDRSYIFLRNNYSVLMMLYCPCFGVWIWSLVMLGYQRFAQSISTILMLFFISLTLAWYNCNRKSNRPPYKSFPWWILRGIFLLVPCRVDLDQRQLQIPNVFSLLFQRGSIPHPTNLILFLCWWSRCSNFFNSCVPRLLRV